MARKGRDTDTQAHAERTLNDPRWAAVVSRNAEADGRFFYSVKTTGVYCRPSCGARTPRPENVSFHGTPAEAELAGYRPCKRCRPDQGSLQARHGAMVTEVCHRLDSGDPRPSLAQLAREVGISPFHLHRIFKAVTGLTPKAYAEARRALRLQAGLAQGATVTEAAYGAGFNSSGHFYAAANKLLGMGPKHYRAGGRGEVIRFALGACSLGTILVAASQAGVCAIALGDDPEALVREIQDRFPHAELMGGDAHFEQWMAVVVGFVEAPGLGLDLPLDVRGTAFQQRVWQALREIPPGSVTTYSELAQRLGMPGSPRAVARAIAANPIAVAIPCHRVIRIDGGLAGYRWGVVRKQALIQREAEQQGQD